MDADGEKPLFTDVVSSRSPTRRARAATEPEAWLEEDVLAAGDLACCCADTLDESLEEEAQSLKRWNAPGLLTGLPRLPASEVLAPLECTQYIQAKRQPRIIKKIQIKTTQGEKTVSVRVQLRRIGASLLRTAGTGH